MSRAYLHITLFHLSAESLILQISVFFHLHELIESFFPLVHITAIPSFTTIFSAFNDQFVNIAHILDEKLPQPTESFEELMLHALLFFFSLLQQKKVISVALYSSNRSDFQTLSFISTVCNAKLLCTLLMITWKS